MKRWSLLFLFIPFIALFGWATLTYAQSGIWQENTLWYRVIDESGVFYDGFWINYRYFGVQNPEFTNIPDAPNLHGPDIAGGGGSFRLPADHFASWPLSYEFGSPDIEFSPPVTQVEYKFFARFEDIDLWGDPNTSYCLSVNTEYDWYDAANQESGTSSNWYVIFILPPTNDWKSVYIVPSVPEGRLVTAARYKFIRNAFACSSNGYDFLTTDLPPDLQGSDPNDYIVLDNLLLDNLLVRGLTDSSTPTPTSTSTPTATPTNTPVPVSTCVTQTFTFDEGFEGWYRPDTDGSVVKSGTGSSCTAPLRTDWQNVSGYMFADKPQNDKCVEAALAYDLPISTTFASISSSIWGASTASDRYQFYYYIGGSMSPVFTGYDQLVHTHSYSVTSTVNRVVVFGMYPHYSPPHYEWGAFDDVSLSYCYFPPTPTPTPSTTVVLCRTDATPGPGTPTWTPTPTVGAGTPTQTPLPLCPNCVGPTPGPGTATWTATPTVGAGTPTPTAIPTCDADYATPTVAPTETRTPTATATPFTATPLPPSPSVTPGGPTLTPGPTWTPKPTWTPGPTWTPPPTWTPEACCPGCVCEPSCTPVPTWTPEPTWTPGPTWTPEYPPPTGTPEPTWTPGPTWTPPPTWTPEYPISGTFVATWTPEPTWTPPPTWTPWPTDISGPTNTPPPTWTPEPTWTPMPTWTPGISFTATPAPGCFSPIKAEAPSSAGEMSPDKMIDGNDGSAWVSGETGDQIIRVTLPSNNQRICSIKIRLPFLGRAKRVLLDNNTTVWTGIIGGDAEAYYDINLNGCWSTGDLSIVVDRTSPDFQAGVYEVKTCNTLVPLPTPTLTPTPPAITWTVVITTVPGVPVDDSGTNLWDFLIILVQSLFDLLMALLQPFIDLIYFLMWLIVKIVELIGYLLWPLWWAFNFLITLIGGLSTSMSTAAPVDPLELGDLETGFSFAQTMLASTPFAVLIYLVNAILWWRFIVWAMAQFSHLT